MYRWLSGPVWLWSPSCHHQAAAAALQPGQDCSDTHHYEQLQLHLEEMTEEVLGTVVFLELFAFEELQSV